LTRRAKHWHDGIIERVQFSPRGMIRSGFFHVIAFAATIAAIVILLPIEV